MKFPKHKYVNEPQSPEAETLRGLNSNNNTKSMHPLAFNPISLIPKQCAVTLTILVPFGRSRKNPDDIFLHSITILNEPGQLS